MEPRSYQFGFTATSSLSRDQMEVFRLYQLQHVNISNEKFQALWALVTMKVPTELIVDLLRDVANTGPSHY